jgi:tetratricopeptide (TPR) repeat protein
MIRTSRPHRNSLGLWLILIILFVIPASGFRVFAQDSQESEREQALRLLWREAKAAAALPLLEKLAKERPDDGLIAFSYGYALVAKVAIIKDAAARKKTRLEARSWLLKAEGLGVKDALLTSLLAGIPPDGGGDEVYSSVKEADEAMRDGEALYVQGNFAEAAEAYQRALRADPKLYQAALYTGDMYFKLNQNEKAEEWYGRAIQIDPDRETAYRYSATPYLKAGKLDEAKRRYIDAVIAEPYNRMTWRGLSQWAEAAGVRLGHPRIEIPTNVKPGQNNNISITLDPKILEKDDPTGNAAWFTYGLHRATWKISEFAKAFPNEKEYRHSLREEVGALSQVVSSVKQRQKDKKITQLDPSLANLVKLQDEGLLEAYILFVLVDDGIVQDYREYRKANREKLKKYLFEYVTAP